MKKGAWKSKIKKATYNVGTFREAFEPVIETLANILAERDKIYEEFVEKGGQSVVEYTNKNGNTNLVKNPLLVTWNEMNTSALSYWRELGLTPAGLKKINESALNRKESVLGSVLKELAS